MKEPIKFCYKGDRNYVHGTDIFNAISAFYLEHNNSLPSTIEMSIHHITRNNMTLVIDEDLSASDKVAVNCSIPNGNNVTKIALVENDEKVTCSYEYEEEDIVASAFFSEEEKAITLKQYDRYTLIEKIVALNKGLLQTLFPGVKGKWYFTKLKLDGVDLNIQSPKEIKLCFKKNMNFKLTQSEVLVEGKTIGNIYFSLV